MNEKELKEKIKTLIDYHYLQRSLEEGTALAYTNGRMKALQHVLQMLGDYYDPYEVIE